MPSADGPIVDLAGAILDGAAIDWTTAESAAASGDRPLLAQLRILARLAKAHRPPGASSPDKVDRQTPRPGNDCLDQWGHLRVRERIGSGTFGDVYHAWDPRLDREVALKLLQPGPDTEDTHESSIIEEGRLLVRVRHPNVVTIYGAERLDNRVGLWMELVKGRTLQQAVEQGKVFSPAETVDIGMQLCRAVAAVHEAGLLHRDIKPHNAMLADDGRVVLMDFGAGRELDDRSRAALAGTPLYLAPELV